MKAISKPLYLRALQKWSLYPCPCCRRNRNGIWDVQVVDPYQSFVNTCRGCGAVFHEDLIARRLRWEGLK